MKPSKISSSGRKIFYLDLNDNIINIGDSLKVRANSGGAVKEVEGILESIDNFGDFLVGGKKLRIESNVLFNKSTPSELWFKCYEHSRNGHIYSVEKLV